MTTQTRTGTAGKAARCEACREKRIVRSYDGRLLCHECEQAVRDAGRTHAVGCVCESCSVIRTQEA